MHTITTLTETCSTRAHRSSRCAASRSRRAWRGDLAAPNTVAHSASYAPKAKGPMAYVPLGDTLDALQRKTQETITIGSNTHTITTTWTATGQKASQTTPGGLKADYSYDSNQQLAGVSLPVGSIGISERESQKGQLRLSRATQTHQPCIP